LLYDTKRKATTVEVDIKDVRRFKREGDYQYRNSFVPGTVRVLVKPISLSHIGTVAGFESFAKGMAGAWNVTREQYKQLTEMIEG
jgi:hypothetical protein